MTTIPELSREQRSTAMVERYSDLYDRWVFSEACMRNDRPTAVELVRRYGSWASAMEVILPQEEDDVLEEDTEQGALALGLPSAVRRAAHAPQQSLGF